MALGSVISVFGKEKIGRMFAALKNKKLGVFVVFPASLLGIVSPLCLFGTIPLVASISGKGMDEDTDFQAGIAAFMMSSILLNPQILFYTAALGHAALIVRFITCFLCGAAAGICVRYFLNGKSFFNFSSFREPVNRDTDPSVPLRLLKNFGRNIKATGPYLLVGIVLSVLFQRYVPQEAFVSLFVNNRGFGLLMAATIGVPLYLCGGAAIPLIFTWLHHGMSAGAVSSFMIAGPAMRITSLGALKMALGIKHFLFYLLFSVLFAYACGLAVDLLAIALDFRFG